MTIQRLVKQRLGGLIIKRNNAPPTNSPPVWDTQPAPVFIQGVSASYAVQPLASDPNGDTVTFGGGLVIPVPGFAPDGITWNAGTESIDYDGSLPPFTYNNITDVTIIADDGTDTTVSAPFTLEISGGGGAVVWPAYGAHVQSSANVSSLDAQLADPWQAKKDLVYLQFLYPDASRVNTTYDGVVSMKAANTNLKLVEYCFPTMSNATGGARHRLSAEVESDNSSVDKWRAFSTGGGSSEQVYVQGSFAINPNFEGTDAAGSYGNFALALWGKYEQKSGNNQPKDLRRLLDGLFWDSTGFKDKKPNQRALDGTTSLTTDYLQTASSGSSDPALYREGYIYAVNEFNTRFGSEMAHSSNGGRDNSGVNKITSENEWRAFWGHRLVEHVEWKIRVEKKAGLKELFVNTANPDARLEEMFRSAKISLEMVDQTGTNKFGKGLVSLDYVFTNQVSEPEGSWTGAAPTIANIPQDYYEIARFICGLSMLDDGFMPGPCLTRGTLGFPYMDELVYDTGGDALSGTPSIGTIDNTSTAYTFTRRAADNNGFLWVVFPDVMWVTNLNEITGGGVDYPQAAEDTCTLPDPDLGGGEVWRYAVSDHVNTVRVTGATTGEDQSPLVNDGSLTGATIDMKRWTSRMLVRSAS